MTDDVFSLGTPQADTARQDEAQGVRMRMPSWCKEHLLVLKGGKKYLPAAIRIAWFREDHPDWGVETELLAGVVGEDFACAKATVRDATGRIVAQATKTETKSDFKDGWVEKAETGAFSRALIFLGYGTQYSGGGDDEQARETFAPHEAADNGAWPGPGPCPKCHAPEGRRHASSCSMLRSAVFGTGPIAAPSAPPTTEPAKAEATEAETRESALRALETCPGWWVGGRDVAGKREAISWLLGRVVRMPDLTVEDLKAARQALVEKEEGKRAWFAAVGAMAPDAQRVWLTKVLSRDVDSRRYVTGREWRTAVRVWNEEQQGVGTSGSATAAPMPASEPPEEVDPFA